MCAKTYTKTHTFTGSCNSGMFVLSSKPLNRLLAMTLVVMAIWRGAIDPNVAKFKGSLDDIF